MVHLHMRSCYSLLRSSNRIQNIVDHSINLGFRHVCLTDRHVMFGTMEFWHYCLKKNIHPIFGMEVEVNRDDDIFHFVLLAKNDLGLQALYRLSSLIQERISFMDLLPYCKHCVVISFCEDDTLDAYLRNNDIERLKGFIQECETSFPCFYIGICKNDSTFYRERNHLFYDLGSKMVALSLIYYENEEDVEQVFALRAIDQQKYMDDPSLHVSYGRYLRSIENMQELYSEDLLQASDEIASMCNVQMAFQKSKLPVFKNKLGVDSKSFLIGLCRKGLEKRLHGRYDQVYASRLDYELNVINQMGFTDYFLIVYDFIRYARSQDIFVGPGRGSAAGSLVAYCLGITHIDPIANHLLFERFLNPERISMPDIDTDFPDDKRDQVIDYVSDLYGKDRVSHIVTFNTLKAKQVLRDVGRVKNIPMRTIDELSKMISTKETLQDVYRTNANFRKRIESNKQLSDLFTLCLKMEGLPRHTSLHAAGIVLSDQPIVNVCPLIQVDEHVHATQFVAEYLEELGLIKMDFLGIRNLTTIYEIVSKLKQDLHISLDMMKLNMKDAKTYSLLAKGNTLGIFQLESSGITSLLMKMKPTKFEDISVVLALYRPGAMAHIDTYIERKEDPSKVTYLHPKLEPVLKETYGIMIYQEQVMQTAQVIAGFSLGQADILRKAMSKKDPDVMASFREQFISGANQNGIKTKLASSIFDEMERFAGYGFNKSHSYAYGLIAYQMAYLKANYPLYFYQSLLNSAIGSESKTSQYIYECKNRGIPILPCSVNHSKEHYKIEGHALRMPLQVLKGIGRSVYPFVISNAPYIDFFDFVAKMSVGKISESSILILIDGGALDEFGYNRLTLRDNLKRVIDYMSVVRIEDPNALRFDFSIVSKPSIQKIKENVLLKSQREKAVYGFYLSEHPVTTLRRYKYNQCIPISSVLKGSGYASILARVIGYRRHQTKKGDWMCFMSVEDEDAKMDIVLMPKLYEVEKENIERDRICWIQGRKDREKSMVANKIQWIDIKEGLSNEDKKK